MIYASPENTFYALDAALAQPELAEVLYLNDQQAEALPETLDRLPNLRGLSLSLHNLRRLPDALPPLTTLFLDGPRSLDLDQAFERLGALPSLSSLTLHACTLPLPPSIGRLAQLESLMLEGGDVDTLPADIGRLTRLTRLHLGTLPLRSLPPEIGELTALRSLRLSGSIPMGRVTPIERLPDTLGRLGALEELFLWHLGLKGLPSTLGDLAALRHLTLAFLPLPALPDCVGALPSLDELSLRSLTLDLPAVVRQLAPSPRLRRLSVEFFSEATLPRETAAMASLVELLIPHCMRLSVEEGFAPPPKLELLTVPRWTFDVAHRARIDAALPRKLWSGRNERDSRVYRRKAPRVR